jgi:hypothetical protein
MAPPCPPGCVSTEHSPAPSSASSSAQRRRARERRAEQQAQEEQAREEQEAQARAQQDAARREQQRVEQRRIADERAYQEAIVRKRNESARLDEEERQRQAESAMADAEAAHRGGGPRPWRPRLMLGISGGMGGFTGDALNLGYVGPTWGARVGIAFLSWLALEARYVGMWNAGFQNNVGQGVSLTTNGGYADMRFTLPIRAVQPYVYSGFGAFVTTPIGNSAQLQSSSLRTNTSAVVPIGIGLDIPIRRHWGIGMEFTYNILLSDNFSTNPALNSGDFWDTGTVVHVAF